MYTRGLRPLFIYCKQLTMVRFIRKVVYKEKRTGKVLKTYTYPNDKLHSKFFWEKMKLEELSKLLKARDLAVEDVIMSESVSDL